MKIMKYLRAALTVLALAFAFALSACAQTGTTPNATVPTPSVNPEDSGAAGVSGVPRSGDPSAVAATVQAAVAATVQAQPKPATADLSVQAAAATPFAYDGPQPKKSYGQDTGNDTVAYDLGVNNFQVGLAYGDALQWGTTVLTDTTNKGCAFVVLTRGWFDRFTITNGGYAVFTVDPNYRDQGVRAVTEQQAAMLALKGCPARTSAEIDQLASDHPSPPGFDLNEPTDNNVVAHPVKGLTESTGKEHSFTRDLTVAEGEVGVVFGIRIKYNGNEIGDRTNGCALAILRPGSYPGIYILDGRYERYAVDPNDYEFWLEDLAVKRADEQAANYGCPKKTFAEIAQWTPETSGQGATNSSVAPTAAPAGAAAPAARPTAVPTPRPRVRPTAAAAPAAPKANGGEDNNHGRNGRLRRASGNGATLAFEPGDEIIGYRIIVDGNVVCDGGGCHVVNASKGGQVVDGVVNPWAKEVPADAKEVDLNAAAAAPAAPAEPTAAAAAPPATGGEDDNHGRNGRVRIATGGGKSHDFAPGDEVIGYRIVVGDTVLCDGGDCHWQSATSAGTVTDGVVNPWSGEIPSSPKEVAGR